MIGRLKRAVVALSLGLTIGFVLVAQESRAGETVTVTDTEGRTVEAPRKPERVLLGFYFEDFQAIVGDGALDRVVAIPRVAWAEWRPAQFEAYKAIYPEVERFVDIGYNDAGGFTLETAIAAEPDVAIIAGWQYRGIGEAGVAKLEAAGIPVVVTDYNSQTLEKHLQSTKVIGQIMGSEARAEQLSAEYAGAHEDVARRVKSAGGDLPRVYVELARKGPGEYDNSYGNVMWGGVVKMAGGRNIAEGRVERWGPLNPEFVISQNPQAIFLAGSEWSGREAAVLMGFGVTEMTAKSRMRPYLARPGWSELEAVKTGEVHAIYHGGARTLYDYVFLQYVAKTLYPKAFADVDPQANHRRFYETYLPVAADGTFMTKLD